MKKIINLLALSIGVLNLMLATVALLGLLRLASTQACLWMSSSFLLSLILVSFSLIFLFLLLVLCLCCEREKKIIYFISVLLLIFSLLPINIPNIETTWWDYAIGWSLCLSQFFFNSLANYLKK